MKQNRLYKIIRWLCIIVIALWCLRLIVTQEITRIDIGGILTNFVILVAFSWLTAPKNQAK